MPLATPVTAVPRPLVLVVDDDPSNLAIVASVLQPAYRLRLANGGEKALALAASERPDLVLLDVEMPGLDGYDVCARLKGDPRLADVPVVFLTGRGQVEDEMEGFARGAVDYIHKPISPAIVAARVRTHLSLRAVIEDARRERVRADELLEVVLPRRAAEELRRTGAVQPRRLDSVGILFCDIVEFTSFCDRHEPEVVVEKLDTVFRRLEEVTRSHGVEKLRTLGDGFMAGVGVLDPCATPLETAVRCGLELAREVPRAIPEWKVRVGVHVGPAVSGIVGGERYQFDVWGAPVNFAAGLVSAGPAGVVTVHAAAWPSLAGSFRGEPLGRVMLKGLGEHEVVAIHPE